MNTVLHSIARPRLLSLAAAGWLALSAGFHDPSLAVEPADLVGEWELDEVASDDPLDRMLEALRRQPFRAGNQAQYADQQNRRALEDGIRWLEDNVEHLAIEEADGVVRFVLGQDTEIRVPSDGGSFSRVGPNYQVFKSKAKWRKKGLELSSQSDLGGRLLETYRVTDDGNGLEVSVQVRGRGGSATVTYQRVYERVETFPWE